MNGFRISIQVGAKRWTEMENRARVNELTRRLEAGFMCCPELDEAIRSEARGRAVEAPEELNRHGIRKL